MIADVKPRWYILSYEVLNAEPEAHTGANGGDVQNLEIQLFLKKHYLHPVAHRAYGHSGYALSLWIRGAHAPTEKRKVHIKIAIVSINPRPGGGLSHLRHGGRGAKMTPSNSKTRKARRPGDTVIDSS